MCIRDSLQLAVPPSYQLIAYVAVLGLLAIGTRTGVDDVGTIGAVLVLLLRSLGYGQGIQVARTQFTNANVYISSLADEIERFSAATPTVGTDLSNVQSGVSAIDLRFAYSDGLGGDNTGASHTLEDVTFDIPAGATCAIVGPSGSGKSTLSHLLAGIQPSAGALLVDGVAVDHADPQWWSDHVAFVPQHSQLLTGTFRDNVRFLRPHITDDQIEQACKLAGIHQEILAMGGYDASVGERGGAMSGGQQQRLCIARALAGSPRLLILDEPTSALDSGAESRVLEGLESLGEDTTIVAITHRHALLDICDVVIELQDGRTAFAGTTAEYTTASEAQ